MNHPIEGYWKECTFKELMEHRNRIQKYKQEKEDEKNHKKRERESISLPSWRKTRDLV